MILNKQKFLKPHLTGFFGLYCLIPLYFNLAGIICSSIEFSISGLMVPQLFLTLSITG